MNARRLIGGRRHSPGVLVPALAMTLLVTGCGQDDQEGAAAESDDAGSAAESEACESYPVEDVSLIVPYAPGGGFDTWARLMAPYLSEYLGANVQVENIEGGGGMRAVNQVYAAPPDGSTIIFTEPGFMSVNQVLGRAGDLDVRNMTYLGQTTVDPQVFTVAPDSGIESIEDLARQPVNHAAQDISPIETITYDAFGVDAEYILHEGTAETVLAIQRGDADVTVTSLSSILEYLRSGDLQPILFLGTEEITPDLLGYEQLENVPTVSDLGHAELAEALEQFRVLAAPPELSECAATPLSEALSDTLSDPDFEAEATEANLRVIPAGAEETQQRVAQTYETFEEYSDTLEAAISD